MTHHLQVFVPPHPLIKHWLAVMRNAGTPCPIFKSSITELSKILLYECVRDFLPTNTAQIETPLGVQADVEYIDPEQPLALVPVLRAGLAMAEAAQTIIPASVTYHVGYVRDESTLQASAYLNKLPENFNMDSKVIVMDIMLATGVQSWHTKDLV
jgi:uracil phosphoribosyltransferase